MKTSRTKKQSVYAAKLTDPRWQRKRLEVLHRDEWKCQLCGDSETELHVHHKLYKKGKEPWENKSSELTTLCKDCHGRVTLAKFDVSRHLDFEPMLVAVEDLCRTFNDKDNFLEACTLLHKLATKPLTATSVPAKEDK